MSWRFGFRLDFLLLPKLPQKNKTFFKNGQKWLKNRRYTLNLLHTLHYSSCCKCFWPHLLDFYYHEFNPAVTKSLSPAHPFCRFVIYRLLLLSQLLSFIFIFFSSLSSSLTQACQIQKSVRATYHGLQAKKLSAGHNLKVFQTFFSIWSILHDNFVLK